MAATAILILVLFAAMAVGCNGVEPVPTFAPTSPGPSPATAPPAPVLPAPTRTVAQPSAPVGAPDRATPSPASPARTLPAAPASAASPAPTDTPPQLRTLRLEPALGGREFDSPTNLVQATDGTLWITEQTGRIRVAGGMDAGQSVSVALDLTDRVSSRRSEEGLLGLAFDPGVERHLYVYYSAARPRRSVVSRFTLSPDRLSVAPHSELVILEVEQPYANHNGGQIAFGPDGYLYIGLGDGGSAGDPQGHGQDTSTLLGSILRIDVSNASPQHPYAIPPDNPFAAGRGRGEIWAFGLRNPWRFSFDRDTGDLWAGDVGQNRWEEIDLIRRGGNHGWNVLEGNHCFQPRTTARATA